jgi:cytochrome c553
MVSELGTSVEVKPLEWRPSETDAELATTVIGEYSVFVNVDDERGEWWEAWRERAYLSAWATEDEAKAAAEADYEQRIRSALIQPTPAEAEGVCQVCHGTGFTGSGDRTKECACQSRSSTPPPIGDGEMDLGATRGPATQEEVHIDKAARDFARQYLPNTINGSVGRVMGMSDAVKLARRCIRYGMSVRSPSAGEAGTPRSG